MKIYTAEISDDFIIILLVSMKLRIFTLFLVLILLTVNCKDEAPDNQDDDENDDITVMTFFTEYQHEADNDMIEIGVLVEAEDYSLKNALKEANELVASVIQAGEEFCNDNSSGNDHENCDEAVDTGDFEVSADYEKVKRQLEFTKFIVSYEITINVYATDKIGELADDLIKIGVTKIQSFDWASNEEDESEEGAIEQGQEKAHNMCFHLGMKLHQIVSIEEVEEQEEEASGEEQQQEEEEEEAAPIVHKFNIECIIDEETAREKAESEQQEKAEKEKEEEQEKKKKKDDDDDDEEDKKKSKKDKKKKSKKE